MSQGQQSRPSVVPVEEYTAFLVGGVQNQQRDSPYKDLPKASKTQLGRQHLQHNQHPTARGYAQVSVENRQFRNHQLSPHLHPEPSRQHLARQRTSGPSQHQDQRIERQQIKVQGEYRTSGSNVSRARSQRVHINAPNPPAPQRRVEMVPYEEKYIDYVEQKQRVPVQKMFTDYFEIEHITDYVPIERYEIVYVTEARQVTDYKLEYVPVQRKIIHLSEQIARREGLTQGNNLTELPPGMLTNQKAENVQAHSAPLNEYFQPRKSRTNFVTTDNYDPHENIRRIDQILTESAVREQRAKENSRLIM